MKSLLLSRLDLNTCRVQTGSQEPYLLRYRLIPPLPEGSPVDDLPGFRYETEWDGWEAELAAHESAFALKKRGGIIGAPEEASADAPAAKAIQQEGRFSIRFAMEEDERFFGLGEGQRERLCLNGEVYQNFARYQRDEIPVPFLMSNRGRALLMLSESRHFVDVDSRGDGWLTVTGLGDPDLLVFTAQDMPALLGLYARYTGRSMVLPRWAYGLTYIAPIFATQFDVLRDAEKMQELGIPCQHFSLEPGWQKTFYDTSLNKEWCMERFHMPPWLTRTKRNETFVSALERMGIHLSLWTCIDYDFTDEAERSAGLREGNAFEPWYNHLGKLVTAGVSGFKLDPANMLDPYQLTANHNIDPNGLCANGEPYARMHNLMQVMLPKQVCEGFMQQTGKRPMLHYCGGYTGIQQWCAATTGDNGGQLGAMIWLQTLALSGHSNTTVDMELFTPESQHFAFFAPWAHLNAWQGVLQPWYAGEKLRNMFIRYAQLRSRLLPYIYSCALEAHLTGMPMIRPMPLVFEECDTDRQYLFGPSMMVGAYTDTLQLPEGRWFDVWTGRAVEGGQTIRCDTPEEWGGALLIREGSVIPAKDDILHLFPRAEGESSHTLYEDDGETPAYLSGEIASTTFTMQAKADGVQLIIGDAQGTYAGKPAGRCWRICLHDSRPLSVTLLNANDSWQAAGAPEGLQL